MSTDQPHEPPPNQPQPGNPYSGPHGAPPPGDDGPFGGPPPGGGGPYARGPYDRGPYGQGPGGPGGPSGQSPFGGGPDPMAGMPPLAEGGKRLLARIIDIIIVLIPAGLLDWAVGGINGNDFNSGRSAVGGLFTAGIGFLYEWYMTKTTGQTLGKRWLKLRAAMLADGSVPPSSAAALRALVLWLPAFCCSCAWFLIIGITVLADKPYKQGIQDKAARTVVVMAD